MRYKFEIIGIREDDVTVECEALHIQITIGMDGVWSHGIEYASRLVRGGYDLAEWALRVATVGASADFSLTEE